MSEVEKAMYRDSSILIASLIWDITSPRIATAGQLGDWMTIAKDLVVRSVANVHLFPVTYLILT